MQCHDVVVSLLPWHLHPIVAERSANKSNKRTEGKARKVNKEQKENQHILQCVSMYAALFCIGVILYFASGSVFHFTNLVKKSL
jgi:hypothetical protein